MGCFKCVCFIIDRLALNGFVLPMQFYYVNKTCPRDLKGTGIMSGIMSKESRYPFSIVYKNII